ncbi:MAG: hypothetical protein R3C10_14985 [Pirellulales bacterium]|nr:hypothetical protein [Planctomycetales bacterium]
MRYIWSLSIAVGVVATGAMNVPSARGDWFARLKCDIAYAYDSICRGYEMNRDWPEPYYHEDKQAVREPFAIMIAKGWRQQNTLGSHHFQENSAELTEAGRMRIFWIANHANEPYRTVFVEQAGDPAATEERLDSVRSYIDSLTLDASPPQVVETSDGVRGWPADRIDSIERQWDKSMPNPRLPSRQGLN